MSALHRPNVETALTEAGYTAKSASEAIHKNRTWLSQVLSGRVKDPGSSAVADLAKLLSVDISYLYGEQDVPRLAPGSLTPKSHQAKEIPVRGVIQAGLWREVDELFEPREYVMYEVDPGFPNAKRSAYEVQGDSMDLAGILEGDRIVCWDIHDYPFPLRDGDDVVVERTRFAGMLKEWTVKRLFTHPDGMKELRPISSNKSHKSYRIYPDHEADNGEEIAIIGIVLLIGIVKKNAIRRRVDG